MEAVIGLIGVIVGALAATVGTALWHQHTTKTDLCKRVLAFYRSRIESLKQVEGNLIERQPGMSLEVERAPLRAELLLMAPQAIIDAEQELFEYLWSRETDRIIKMYQFQTTGTQVSSIHGAGRYESSAISQARLRHSHELFDKTYELFIELLRQEMRFMKTFEYLLSKQQPLKSPSMFAVHRPSIEAQERVNNDPESLESIWRGRIADQMEAKGATPFEAHIVNETIYSTAGSLDCYVVFYPPSAGPTIESNSRVYRCIGYENAQVSNYHDVERLKQSITAYFHETPMGSVKIMRRTAPGKRDWKEELVATSNDIQKVFKVIDAELQAATLAVRDRQKKQEEEWRKKLENANREAPNIPVKF
jgi:hypothetical protein